MVSFQYNSDFFCLTIKSKMMIFTLKVLNCSVIVALTLAYTSHLAFLPRIMIIREHSKEVSVLYVPKSG